MEKVKTYRLVDGLRIETGELYERDSLWSKDDDGCYIVGVNNWILNSQGEFLVQRRAMAKKNNPGKWSSTNGLIQMGESNIETVIRETKEELGIDVKPNQIHLIQENHIVNEHLMVDIFVTVLDIDLNNIKIQESEVDKICFISLKELLELELSTTCSYIKDLAPYIFERFGSYFL